MLHKSSATLFANIHNRNAELLIKAKQVVNEHCQLQKNLEILSKLIVRQDDQLKKEYFIILYEKSLEQGYDKGTYIRHALKFAQAGGLAAYPAISPYLETLNALVPSENCAKQFSSEPS